MDFYYNGIVEEEEEKEDDDGVRNGDEEHKEDSPSIVLYDSNQKAVASWVMSSKSVTKGGPNDWVPKAMVREIDQWGYGNRKVVLVSDGEPAIKAVKDRMIALREADTVPEETPVGEHNANLAEGMVRRVREQARAIISQMESGAKGKVRNRADVMQWAIFWVAS